jgi:small subunit ribosomal protein S1
MPSSDPTTPDNTANSPEESESFGDLLKQYEKEHRRPKDDSRQLEGTVIKVSADTIYLDIGYKSEGILPLASTRGEAVNPGDKMFVSVKGRNPEGYYELSRGKVSRPTDWASLERAFTDRSTIMGTVTGAIKGGVTVDIGVRAFMPASRSATKDAAELEKLVGSEIKCRIIKIDVADEDVVVDRRAVVEEEERADKDRRYSEIAVGAIVNGTVRSLTDYGAFVNIGGVDALLHVSDISRTRINNPADVLSVGQEIEAQVLKVTSEGDKRRISIGMKQLAPDPWSTAADKYKVGEKVRGTVTRVVDFGAFVELEPGLEGLIHISELSWNRKIKRVSEVVKQGDAVEAVVLGVNLADRRLSLGLKQTLGDPWAEASKKFPVGTQVEGPITNMQKFGAFVQIADGIEGMVHVSDITADRRLNHPQDMLKVGQIVQAQVLAVDPEKRQIKLGMKQLVPTGLDEYLEEHKVGDVVSGRLLEESGDSASVELGEGIHATCRMAAQTAKSDEPKQVAKADLSSLSSMLQARWKGATPNPEKKEPARAGQIRSFRIARLDKAGKKIELELA